MTAATSMGCGGAGRLPADACAVSSVTGFGARTPVLNLADTAIVVPERTKGTSDDPGECGVAPSEGGGATRAE
jgi:hypothetical protein